MKKILVLASLLTLSSSSFSASSCVNIISKISTEINNADVKNNEKPVWQSLSTLQDTLKSKPTKKITPDGQTEYHWTCSPPDQGNFLIALTDKNGALLKVSGQTDTASGGAVFASDIATAASNNTSISNNAPVSSTPAPNNSPAVDTNTTSSKTTITSNDKPPVNSTPIDNSSKPDALPADQNTMTSASDDEPSPEAKRAIASFNEWFGVNIKNAKQLDEISTNKTIAYFSKLRTCTAGTYLYPIFNIEGGADSTPTSPAPLFLLATSTISGYKNGLCVVNTLVKLKDRTAETHCNYSQSTLDYHTDEFAKSFSSEAVAAYMKNPPLQKLVTSECKKIPSKEDIADENVVRDYIVKFKSCTPGTYTAHRGAAIALITTISGYKNNKCILQGSIEVNTEAESNKTVIKCEYSQASLDFFANTKLDTLNGISKPLTQDLISVMDKAFNECNNNWQPI